METNGARANQKPKAMPATVPMTKASAVSSSVMPRWYQMTPEAKSAQVRASTAPGVPKKKGLRILVSVRTCQIRKKAIRTPN